MQNARIAALFRELADVFEEKDIPEPSESKPARKRRVPLAVVPDPTVEVDEVLRQRAKKVLRNNGVL